MKHLFIVLFASVLFSLLLFSGESSTRQFDTSWDGWPQANPDGKRICFLTQELKGPNKFGGIGSTNYNLALLLADQGHKVTIVYAHQTPDEDHWYRYFKAKGILYTEVEPYTNAYILYALFSSFESYQWLRKHDSLCELIHFHDYLGLGYFTALAKHTGIAFQDKILQVDIHAPHKFVREGTNRYEKDLGQIALEFMERKTLEYVDAIVSPSRFILEWSKRNGAQIPPTTEVEIIQNVLQDAERTLPWDHSNRTINEIVFFGKFEPLKGIDIFLNAVDLFSKSPLASKLSKVTMIGVPRLIFNQEYLNARSQKWPFKVNIFTHKTGSFAMKYLQANPNSMAVFPSRVENSPTVVLESASHGACFIASNVGGIPELLKPSSQQVHLFTPNPKSLSEHISSFVQYGCPQPILAHSLEETREIQISWHKEIFQKERFTQIEPTPDHSHIPVCVVIPVYNRLWAVQQALGSLEKQSHRNFHVIIVDDGSPDPSVVKGLSSIQNSFPNMKLRVVRQENQYLGAARNYGATHCEADWIMFLDDDDLSKPHELSTFLMAAHRTGADVLTGYVQSFNGMTDSVFEKSVEYIGIGGSEEMNYFYNALGAANIFIKKAVLEEVGGYSIDRDVYEDWELGARLLLQGKKWIMIPDALYWYRNTPNSMMKTKVDPYVATKKIVELYLKDTPEHLQPILQQTWYQTQLEIGKYVVKRGK